MNERAVAQPANESALANEAAWTGLLQRKCACGKASGLTGECGECSKAKMSSKRDISGHAERPTAPAIVEEVLGSPGQSLDSPTRAFMESRFAHDFSRVRVHADAPAAESARSVNALAYTVGEHIVFGTQQYAPNSLHGQKLLAHELTHVVQQSGAASVSKNSAGGWLQPALEIGQPRDALEQEADQMSADLLSPPTLKVSSLRAQRLQRFPREDFPDFPSPGGRFQDLHAIQVHDCMRRAGEGNEDICLNLFSLSSPAPRPDFVFIMGEDRPGTGNPFYAAALRYFRSHYPRATFVTDLRNIADVLSYIANKVHTPIGHIYIVSHANEDGTLSFALDSNDSNTRLTANELRGALHPARGASSLERTKGQIDRNTTIHIKGCDIGRTQEMVELLDEAFGGEGTVTAPTHEQQYGFDTTLRDRARAEFRAGVEASHPIPEPVDPALKGKARTQAQAARKNALQQRQSEITAERRARSTDEAEIVEKAGNFESFSGPMFQRPGTKLFTAGELLPQVERLYAHLLPAQQQDLVRKLVASDSRPAAQIKKDGTRGQKGQRVDTAKGDSFTFLDPQNAAEADSLFRDDFRANHFKPTKVLDPLSEAVAGGKRLTIRVEGQVSPPGKDSFKDVRSFEQPTPVPDEQTLLATSRRVVQNPDAYIWRVQRTRSNGRTTVAVLAERVIAYLHHQALNVSPTEHFTRPESDPSFFATSTFTPPPPAQGKP